MGQRKKITKKTGKRKRARSSIEKVVKQVKEPLSLLETLKEEGMANAGMLLAMMAGAAKNFRIETIRPQISEVVSSLGFARQSDLDELQVRLDELETRISELGGHTTGGDEDDE